MHVLEPETFSFMLLTKNIYLNDFEDLIIPHRKAAFNKISTG